MFNRTKRYLQPILNTYPKVFKYELSKSSYALYVGDVDYYRTRPFENNLFILIPFNKELIKATRDTKYYKDEYPYNLTDKYVMVLGIPEEYQVSYEMYLEGKYSKMFTRSQITKLGIPQIIEGKINLTYCVLTHDQMAYEEYKKVLKRLYETNHYPLSPDEYDVPPRIRQEVLNSRDNEDFVKSITPLRNL